MFRAATSIGCDSSPATGLSELQGELDLDPGLVGLILQRHIYGPFHFIPSVFFPFAKGLILQRTLPFFPISVLSFCKGVDQLTVHTANGRVLGPFGGTGGVAFDTGDWSRSN